jgi:hypothetical protein
VGAGEALDKVEAHAVETNVCAEVREPLGEVALDKVLRVVVEGGWRVVVRIQG